MTMAGWIMMVASVCFVVTLAGYCFYRVLTTPQSEDHLHAPLDVNTHDRE